LKRSEEGISEGRLELGLFHSGEFCLIFWETRLSNGEPGSMSRLSEPGSAKQEPTSAKSTELLFHDAGGMLRPETFNPDTAKKAI
jgi:hypothetical protein